MKRQNVLVIGCVIILSCLFVSVSAQVVSNDSISILKQEKESISIQKVLNENKLKLAKLENSLEQKMKSSHSTAVEAQNSADRNANTADKLSNDAQDRKLARKARKTAREAQQDAKQARKSSANLQELKDNIESLKRKIADDEARLANLSKVG